MSLSRSSSYVRALVAPIVLRTRACLVERLKFSCLRSGTDTSGTQTDTRRLLHDHHDCAHPPLTYMHIIAPHLHQEMLDVHQPQPVLIAPISVCYRRRQPLRPHLLSGVRGLPCGAHWTGCAVCGQPMISTKFGVYLGSFDVHRFPCPGTFARPVLLRLPNSHETHRRRASQ